MMKMKINKRLWLFLIPFMTGVLCLAYAGLTSWKETHFACDSQLTMIDAYGNDDIIMHFRFDGKTGHVETRGKYTPLKGQQIQTSNKVSFTFWRDGDSLVMVSNDTNRLPKTSPPAFAHTPDFFSSRERGIRLQVIRKNKAGYLFLYDGTPALYCAITD
jgi:hypothetical protein